MMNNQSINPETLRKRNSKQKETAEQREARLECDRECKRRNRANETEERWELRRISDRKRKKRKITMEAIEEHQSRNSRESKRKRETRAHIRSCPTQIRPIALPRARLQTRSQTRSQTRPVVEPPNNNEQSQQETTQRDNDNSGIQPTPLSSNTVSEEEHKLLQKFRKKMDDIQDGLYPVCNERILSMTLIMGMCRCCHTEKSLPKKFSAENHMDPGDVPEELKELSEIEEMLIAQVFTVMSVYRLQGDQNRYRENVINFPQDIQGFTD
jgi:hypothetical protein